MTTCLDLAKGSMCPLGCEHSAPRPSQIIHSLKVGFYFSKPCPRGFCLMPCWECNLFHECCLTYSLVQDFLCCATGSQLASDEPSFKAARSIVADMTRAIGCRKVNGGIIYLIHGRLSLLHLQNCFIFPRLSKHPLPPALLPSLIIHEVS